jgi:hypothetical protein
MSTRDILAVVWILHNIIMAFIYVIAADCTRTTTYTCSDDQSDRHTCCRICSAWNDRRLAYRKSNIVSWLPSATERCCRCHEEDCMPRKVFGARPILSLVPHSVLPHDSLSSVCPNGDPLGQWRVRKHRDRWFQTRDRKR